MDIRNTIKDLKATLNRYKSANNKYYIEDMIVILNMIDDIDSRVEINTVERFKLVERINKVWPDPPQKELKPCPFCGCEIIDVIKASERDNTYWIRCHSCGAESGGHAEIHKARENWNRRSNA